MNRFPYAAILVILLVGSGAFGSIFVPPGLNPGDTYHLAFVSSTTRNATSDDINDYDAHVQAAADAAGIGVSEDVTWYAIASTSTVHARNNAVVTAPVYRMDGAIVANGFDDLWDGSIANPLKITETGGTDPWSYYVWTGTDWNGYRAWFGWLSAWHPECGFSVHTGSTWISKGAMTRPDTYPLYALSEQLTVPDSIPEPSTFIIWSLLGALAITVGWWRRRKT